MFLLSKYRPYLITPFVLPFVFYGGLLYKNHQDSIKNYNPLISEIYKPENPDMKYFEEVFNNCRLMKLGCSHRAVTITVKEDSFYVTYNKKKGPPLRFGLDEISDLKMSNFYYIVMRCIFSDGSFTQNL